MNLDKLDRIVLKEDDVHKLMIWKDQHKDFVRSFKPAMTQGMIVVGDNHQQVFHTDNHSTVNTTYFKGNKIFAIQWNKHTYRGSILYSNVIKEKENEYAEDVISLHASLMAYMEHSKDNQELVSSHRIQVTKTKKGSVSKRSKKVVKISRTVYSIHFNNEDNAGDKRSYERQIVAWTVRGHWRKTKSGRTWIKPYVKGKRQEQKGIVPKIYKL